MYIGHMGHLSRSKRLKRVLGKIGGRKNQQSKVSLSGFHTSAPHRNWHFADTVSTVRGERIALYYQQETPSASVSTSFFVLTF